MRRMATISATLMLMLALSATEFGQQIINLLPFVGSQEQDNVEYRADLLSVSLVVIERNLLFGASDFMSAPELEVMRQGEGIIDIVNSYLGVTLHAGVVGLSLFVGMFLGALMKLRRGMRWARQLNDADGLLLGRALLASVVSVMFIIFTVSGITAVPTIYFSLVGISCAYFAMQKSKAKVNQMRASR